MWAIVIACVSIPCEPLAVARLFPTEKVCVTQLLVEAQRFAIKTNQGYVFNCRKVD